MSKLRFESVPRATPIHDVLDRSAPLASLRERIHDSNRRFAAIAGVLPAALRSHVAPGPVDETGWTLLAANASVAAKLRQLQPRIEQVLLQHGWAVCSVRLRVRPPEMR